MNTAKNTNENSDFRFAANMDSIRKFALKLEKDPFYTVTFGRSVSTLQKMALKDLNAYVAKTLDVPNDVILFNEKADLIRLATDFTENQNKAASYIEELDSEPVEEPKAKKEKAPANRKAFRRFARAEARKIAEPGFWDVEDGVYLIKNEEGEVVKVLTYTEWAKDQS